MTQNNTHTQTTATPVLGPDRTGMKGTLIRGLKHGVAGIAFYGAAAVLGYATGWGVQDSAEGHYADKQAPLVVDTQPGMSGQAADNVARARAQLRAQGMDVPAHPTATPVAPSEKTRFQKMNEAAEQGRNPIFASVTMPEASAALLTMFALVASTVSRRFTGRAIPKHIFDESDLSKAWNTGAKPAMKIDPYLFPTVGKGRDPATIITTPDGKQKAIPKDPTMLRGGERYGDVRKREEAAKAAQKVAAADKEREARIDEMAEAIRRARSATTRPSP